MKLSSVSGLTCQVADLDRTVAFYESLGFRIGKRDAEQATCYVNWFWITFTAAEGPVEAPSGPTVHLKVENIEEAHQGLLDAGHKPESEPAKRSGGGTEFSLLDPDGYRLVFFFKK
ncbi:catechol 2,3-dioxygenase-like lactoylglutathione lyase family enzyme [Streptacidiphilus sp. MAP12-33]|uniref:VOC family protein n=1 Tax=Streptacidiphilus sp. MAP12-33 TaxID=3156266 RepID=UPI003516D6DD